MNKYKIATIMLSKIKPDFNNDIWIKAVKLMNDLGKKTVSSRDSKEQTFCYYVDKIYEDLEVDNGTNLP